MPTKRHPLDRRRKPVIDDEAVALFCELEAELGERDYLHEGRGAEFKARDKDLHQRLGLGGEWFCSVVSVLDRRTEHHSPGSPQDADFRRVRAVRLRLIEAARERGLMTTIPAGPA
jgi:hypothetical protein